jgi:epoxyqueuosine reductase
MIHLSSFIKQTALEIGFDHCGIAKAMRLDDDAKRLEQWLHRGLHGNMDYMANHFELRVDPVKLVPGAKSVITLLHNYYPGTKANPENPKISKYAYGKDYHEVIRNKLNQFLFRIREEVGNIVGRGFVDSAPVLERSWALRSGLGWIGKNGNIIHKKQGSYFFIASLIIDLELDYDLPHHTDHCGTCTRCIDACPTQAILPNKEINGSQCISYFTIELKDALIPQNMKGQFDNWMFGCDICQDVCPWNRFSKPHREPAFQPIPALLEYDMEQWELLTEESFKEIFSHSPLKRAGFKGIQRNLRFIQTDSHE